MVVCKNFKGGSIMFLGI